MSLIGRAHLGQRVASRGGRIGRRGRVPGRHGKGLDDVQSEANSFTSTSLRQKTYGSFGGAFAL